MKGRTQTYAEKDVSECDGTEREKPAGQKKVVGLGLAARSATFFGLLANRVNDYYE